MTVSGPIVIGGLDRSGKTQLRLALELLPDVAWSRKVEPWTRFSGRLGDVRDRRIADRAIGRLSVSPWVAGLAPDAARLRADLGAVLEDATSARVAESRLLALVLAHHAAAADRDRWGLQEAGIERHLLTLLEALPGARSIVLVRDPRDRLAAYPAARRRAGGAGPATGAWLDSVRHATRAARRFPDRVLIVRCEDLATRPAETLRSICEHVDADYSDAMLTPGGGDPFGGLARSVGTFARILRPGEIALVQALAPRAMIALGYEPVAIPLSTVGRAGYWLADAPIGLLRLSASRARTALTGRIS
jgi:Sulfotransferase family